MKAYLFCLILMLSIADLQAQWASTLPQSVQDSIYWLGDHEEGNLNDWTMEGFQYPGGGIFNTGGNDVAVFADNSLAHSGQFSAKASISNAWQAQNGSRAVRLMRWTNTAWDNGGDYFPRASYYSAFFYFPYTYNPNKYAPWDPGDGGWWNIFQFKSNDENDQSQPVWTFNVYYDDDAGTMSLYMYSKYNPPHSYAQLLLEELTIPAQEWVHFEAYYHASDPNTPNGEIRLWQNGELILEAKEIITTLTQNNVVWGIGNYTDHIAGGEIPGKATLYVDDCIVSTVAISPYLTLSTEIGSEASIEGKLIAYPNPTKEYIYFNSQPSKPIVLLDLLGKQYWPSVSKKRLDMSPFSPGIYYLKYGSQTIKVLRER